MQNTKTYSYALSAQELCTVISVDSVEAPLSLRLFWNMPAFMLLSQRLRALQQQFGGFEQISGGIKLSVPPLIFTRSDFEGGRIWPAAGGKFWGISGASKGETLQKVTLLGSKI